MPKSATSMVASDQTAAGSAPSHPQRDELSRISARVLFAFLLLLVYDGALRKWILPGAQSVIFILKDAILLGGLLLTLAMGGSSRSRSVPLYVGVLLAAYAGWVLIGVANPHVPNLAVGLWGLKTHLLYVSLVVLLPLAMGSTSRTVEVVARAYPWIVIPVCLLAVLQVNSPIDSVINKQIDDSLEAISYFGEKSLIRVSGPFSYISGMGAFLQVMGALGIGLLVLGNRSPAFLAAVVILAFAVPTTGSRSVVVFLAAAALLQLVAAAAAGLATLRSTLYILAAATVAGVLSQFVVGDAWEALHQRYIENVEEGQGRVVGAFASAFDFVEMSGLTGYGTGAANLGAVAFTPGVEPFSWLPVRQAFEEEQGRLVLELGAIGFALSMTLRLAIVIWACRLMWFGRSRDVRAVGLLALPFVLAGLYQGTGVFSHPLLLAAYWFIVALLAMAQREQEQVGMLLSRNYRVAAT